MSVANEVLRFVPIVYLISPSTGRRVAVRLQSGLAAEDAADLAGRAQTDEWTDAPLDILHEARLVRLIEHAEDWRFMTPAEIYSFEQETAPFYEGADEQGEEATFDA